jgi:hypothetical protein
MQTTSTPSGIKCRVTIKTATGSRSFVGIYPSTSSAVIHAMDHLAQDGQGHISVRVLP